MLTRRRTLTLAASALAPAVLGRAARAQGWPNRPVRIIVPFPPGGGGDTIARIVGAKLTEIWGQQIIVENKGGAGGNIASDATARSAPDGYTLFLAGDFLATNQFIYPKLSYDPVADFAPVSLVVRFPVVLVVPNSSPAKTFAEFVALAKAGSTPLTYASPGYGTSPHLAAELFARRHSQFHKIGRRRPQIICDAFHWRHHFACFLHEALDLLGKTPGHHINSNQHRGLRHYSDSGQGNEKRQ